MSEIAGMQDPDSGLRSILAVLLGTRGNAVGARLAARTKLRITSSSASEPWARS